MLRPEQGRTSLLRCAWLRRLKLLSTPVGWRREHSKRHLYPNGLKCESGAVTCRHRACGSRLRNPQRRRNGGSSSTRWAASRTTLSPRQSCPRPTLGALLTELHTTYIIYPGTGSGLSTNSRPSCHVRGLKPTELALNSSKTTTHYACQRSGCLKLVPTDWIRNFAGVACHPELPEPAPDIIKHDVIGREHDQCQDG